MVEIATISLIPTLILLIVASIAIEIRILPLTLGFIAYNYPYIINSTNCAIIGDQSCLYMSALMISVYAITLLAAAILDKINQNKNFASSDRNDKAHNTEAKIKKLKRKESIAKILTIIMIVIFAIRFGNEGINMFTYRALDIPGQGKNFFMKLVSSYSYTLSLLSLAAALIEKNRKYIYINVAIQIITLLTGDRTYPSLAIFTGLFIFAVNIKTPILSRYKPYVVSKKYI